MKVAVVIGHSKQSQGATNAVFGASEFEFNERLAHDITFNFSEHNMADEIVVVYRTDYAELPQKINNLNVDLVVSLHANAYNTITSGCETLYYHASNKGKAIAKIFQERLSGLMKTKDRGIKPKHSEDRGGYILRYTKAPCIICEPFFIDNDGDFLLADSLFEKGDLTTTYCVAINEALRYLRTNFGG